MQFIVFLKKRGWRFELGGVLTGAMALVVLVAGCEKPAPPPKSEPVVVDVITATAQDVPVFQEWIGTLAGYPNAQIRAQVAGYLVKQDYSEGGKVKAGDLLFEIDPRPFQAALDQALAKLAQDRAMQDKTELDVKRYTPLAREQALSQEELDDAVQANLGAHATVQADQAAVENARLNLGFCKITSPIDGIAGIAAAQIGDLATPGGLVLTTVSTVDPIRVYFNISEQSYLAFSRPTDTPEERTGQLDGMKLQLKLSDGTTYGESGKWLFMDRQIDANTGTIQVAGLFPNPKNFLRPGQYALVRAQTSLRRGGILIPQRAVTQLQGAYQVVLVDSNNLAHLKTVQVGNQMGNEWLVDKGIEANDLVVVEGAQKVNREGMEVNPKPYQPEAKKP